MKKVICLLMVSILLVLGGCNGQGTQNSNKNNLQDIPPIDTNPSKDISATIYYGYKNTDMLASESRMIYASADKAVEAAIIERLLAGPDPKNIELKRIINPETKLVEVRISRDIITLAFSKELIDPGTDVPSDWENNSELVAQVNRNIKLRVYSIVNTVTEYSQYSKVQIVVDTDGEGKYENVFSGTNDDVASVLTREMAYILSPNRVAQIFLTEFSKRNWMLAYEYVADMENNTKRPGKDEFEKTAGFKDVTIVDNTIADCTVADDGKSAVVTVSYTIRTQKGDVSMLNIPLKLIRERSCWKVPYSFVEKNIFDVVK